MVNELHLRLCFREETRTGETERVKNTHFSSLHLIPCVVRLDESDSVVK